MSTTTLHEVYTEQPKIQTYWCRDCSAGLFEGRPEVWEHVDICYDGDLAGLIEYARENGYVTEYYRGQCGCENEPVDNHCFDFFEANEVIYRCDDCDWPYDNLPDAQTCDCED